MEYNYIYLIQEREFVNSGENVYKLGRSSQENTKRVAQYSKGSHLLLQVACSESITLEALLIAAFKVKYEQCTDIGTETFRGDSRQMMCDIFAAICEAPEKEKEKEKVKVVDEFAEDLTRGENRRLSTGGGTKRLVRISAVRGANDVIELMTTDAKGDKIAFLYNFISGIKYVERLINNDVIISGQIYDLDDEAFCKKLDKYKKKINDVLLFGAPRAKNSQLFADTIINEKYYCNTFHKTSTANIDVKFSSTDLRNFSKISGTYVEDGFLRNHLPHVAKITNSEIRLHNFEENAIGESKGARDCKRMRTAILYEKDCLPWNGGNFGKYIRAYNTLVANYTVKLSVNTGRLIKLCRELI
jgi:hypothetical protein